MGNEEHLKKISIDIIFVPFYIQENNFKMFVVNASHITFVGKYKREPTLFSQLYNRKKFYVTLYSTKTGEILKDYENSKDWKQLHD
jgi:hypothetical protein